MLYTHAHEGVYNEVLLAGRDVPGLGEWPAYNMGGIHRYQHKRQMGGGDKREFGGGREGTGSREREEGGVGERF